MKMGRQLSAWLLALNAVAVPVSTYAQPQGSAGSSQDAEARISQLAQESSASAKAYRCGTARGQLGQIMELVNAGHFNIDRTVPHHTPAELKVQENVRRVLGDIQVCDTNTSLLRYKMCSDIVTKAGHPNDVELIRRCDLEVMSTTLDLLPKNDRR